MHRNYIGAIERGKINPTCETLLHLADGLVLTPGELIEQAETTTKIEPVQRRRNQVSDDDTGDGELRARTVRVEDDRWAETEVAAK